MCQFVPTAMRVDLATSLAASERGEFAWAMRCPVSVRKTASLSDDDNCTAVAEAPATSARDTER